MAGRISLGGAFAFLPLATLVSACAQTVVLEEPTTDGGSQASSDSSANGCPGSQTRLPFTQETPEVVVALDRSSAMNVPFGADPSQLVSALNAVGAQVLHFSAQTQNSQPIIRFAFIDFPDTASDCNAMLGCCTSDVTPTASYSAFELATSAACEPPNDCLEAAERPTASALSKSQDFLGNDPQPGQQYVLLVTDGPPSGCSTSGRDPCNDAIAQIGNLSNSGVQTTIVSIGGDSTAGCLLNLASAEGAEGPPFYYTAASPNDLTNVIATITSAVAQNACRLDLSTTQYAAEQLSVSFGVTTVPRDTGHNNGWDLSGNGGRITLYGTACQELMQTGVFGLTISGCTGGHFGQQP